MKNVFPTITVRMMFHLMQQVLAFPATVTRKVPMDHAVASVVNATVNQDLWDQNVQNVCPVIQVKTAPNAHATKEELCTAVNVNLIANVR